MPGISILNLGESHMLVSDDDGYTVTVNPLAYINTVLKRDDSSDSLKNLMRALYLYYEAAVAYQNG